LESGKRRKLYEYMRKRMGVGDAMIASKVRSGRNCERAMDIRDDEDGMIFRVILGIGCWLQPRRNCHVTSKKSMERTSENKTAPGQGEPKSAWNSEHGRIKRDQCTKTLSAEE
jgi:hypothetical protein